MGGMNIFRGQNGEVEDYLPKNPLAAGVQGAVLGAGESLPIQAIMAILRGAAHAFTAPGRAVSAIGNNRAGLGPPISPVDAALYGRDMNTGVAPASYGTLLQKTALGEDDNSKLGDVLRYGGDTVADPIALSGIVGAAGAGMRAAMAEPRVQLGSRATMPADRGVRVGDFPAFRKDIPGTPPPSPRPAPAAVKAPGDVWPGEPANEATHARFFREQNEFGPQSSRPAVGETSRAAMDEGAPVPKVKQTGKPKLRGVEPGPDATQRISPDATLPADYSAKAQEAALADEGAAAIEQGDNLRLAGGWGRPLPSGTASHPPVTAPMQPYLRGFGRAAQPMSVGSAAARDRLAPASGTGTGMDIRGMHKITLGDMGEMPRTAPPIPERQAVGFRGGARAAEPRFRSGQVINEADLESGAAGGSTPQPYPEGRGFRRLADQSERNPGLQSLQRGTARSSSEQEDALGELNGMMREGRTLSPLDRQRMADQLYRPSQWGR